MQHKASQGEYTGGQAPYGRRVAGDGERLEPDPTEEEARAVARQLRTQGACRCAGWRRSWSGEACGVGRAGGSRRCR